MSPLEFLKRLGSIVFTIIVAALAFYLLANGQVRIPPVDQPREVR